MTKKLLERRLPQYQVLKIYFIANVLRKYGGVPVTKIPVKSIQKGKKVIL